ncbi:MAG: DUF1800 domain-containing protein [Erythrobacter sp.]
MSRASIALNRFGYGVRTNGAARPASAADLLNQIERFDPSPAILNGREDTSALAGQIIEQLRTQRRQRRELEQSMAASETGKSPARGRDSNLPPELRAAMVTGHQTVRRDAGLRLQMAVQSDTPLIERLVHFWSNHFSVSYGKPGMSHQVGNHEFHAIRPHVLGKFSDMLKAAALHPAMLIYLDQYRSVGPDAPFQQRRRERQRTQNPTPQYGLNENLAREIFELHTLGVDGGYNQADVIEFAQALTGWTVENRRLRGTGTVQQSGAIFADMIHEPGTRRILGKSYSQESADQALTILDELASHPSTARFIATKLARHFSGDDPEPSLIARLEQDFQSSGGDLASLTRTLINAPEAWTGGSAKFRQPFEWLVSAIRITGAEDLSDRRTFGALQQLGQSPWRAPSPAGYDDLAGSWAGPDALFRRIEVAERFARNAPLDDVVGRAENAFPGALSGPTKLALQRAESSAQALALLLVSPEMMRR